jgi:hypothetical protein
LFRAENGGKAKNTRAQQPLFVKVRRLLMGGNFTTKLDLKSATADDLPQNCL